MIQTSNWFYSCRVISRYFIAIVIVSFCCGGFFPTFAADTSECGITGVPQPELKTAAKRIVDHISTFTPENAEERFRSARAELADPALADFEKDMMGSELSLIRETKRTQEFTYKDEAITIDRYPGLGVAIVVIPGTRQKRIGDKFLPADEVAYYVKLKPRCETKNSALSLQAIDLRLRRLGDKGGPTLDDLSARYTDPPMKDLIEALKGEFATLKHNQIFEGDILKRTHQDLSEHKERVKVLLETIVEKFEVQQQNIEVLHKRIENIEKELNRVKK